jgi:hypothetical protein
MTQARTDKAILMAAFARIDAISYAIAMGVTCALLLFGATAALLLKGPDPGRGIGEHLSLIGIYLPGYDVTWAGGLLGAFYALLIGGAFGYILAVLWNLTHYLYITAIVVRAAWWRMMAE